MITWEQRGWTFWPDSRTDCYLEIAYNTTPDGFYLLQAVLNTRQPSTGVPMWGPPERMVPARSPQPPPRDCDFWFAEEAKEWAEGLLLTPLEQLAGVAE